MLIYKGLTMTKPFNVHDVNDLNKLFKKYNADKSSNGHFYFSVYGKDFSPYREDAINILEIGIWKGASCEAWLDFFPNANVYGVDTFQRVDPRDVSVLQDNRMKAFKLDSTANIHSKLKDEFGDLKFDFIIDDGLHTPEANQKTFENFMPFLKEEEHAAYYIEDAWPLDILTHDEMEHPWITSRQDIYNMIKFSRFKNVIDQYKVDRYDLRKQSKKPDSYIFRVKHEI